MGFHIRKIIKKYIFSIYSYIKYKYWSIDTYLKFGKVRFPYCGKNGKNIYILCNGPSLKEEINSLLEKKIDLKASMVVNSFALSEYFLSIKPQYYCIADPGFFDAKHIDTTVPILKKINDAVNWNMILFIPLYEKNTINYIRQYIPNTFVKIRGIPILTYEGFESRRYKLYKKGEAVPSFVNVSIMCLYILLNLGYSKINLFGVDHSFLASMCIDDNNNLCTIDHHFYGSEKITINRFTNDHKWKMADFVYDKYLTFKEHENMRGYADFLGAEVINHTKDSWIDAYTRISQVEKSKKQNI